MPRSTRTRPCAAALLLRAGGPLAWAAPALAALVVGCAGSELAEDPRAGQLELAFSRQFLVLTRSRPRQLSLRFAEMEASPHRFLRGSEFLYVRDLRDPTLPFARTDLSPPRALLQGDAHVENIGTFAPPTGATIELNDFDAAGFGPPHWEVRRAAASLVVVLREVNPGHDEAALATRVAASYAEAIAAGRAGATAPGEVGKIIGKRAESAAKDGPAREELADFTELAGGARRLRRGGTDPEDPREALLDAPPRAAAEAPLALRRYRETLARDDFGASYFDIKDLARRCGQGVGSLTSARLYALVEGPSASPDDDVLLQLKEATDASLDADLSYGSPASDPAQRVVSRQRALQSTPEADPRLGYTRLLDLPVVVSTVTASQKTVRPGDLAGRAADDLLRFAGDLGELLARAHARARLVDGQPAGPSLRAWLAGNEAVFAAETARASLAYADQVAADHRRFQALRSRLGPLLGLSPLPAAPSASEALSTLDPPCP